MKKISVLLLICMLFLNIGSVSIFAQNSIDYTYDIEVVNKLGIMTGDDNGDFKPQDCLTRAEFAKIVCVLDGFDDRTIYTENANYKDLSINHWAYNYICYVSQRGYMTGDDNKRFRPDDCITGNEVTKVLIHMLGYYYKVPESGGYPTGYMATAKTLGIYKGFEGNTYDYILREETAKLINNSLDIPIMELLTVGTSFEYGNFDGITLLSKTFNMKRGKGTVLATDSASILSNDIAQENYIVIDGVSMKASGDFTNLLGSEVNYIYKFVKDDDSLNELFYYYLSKSSNVTISKEDFVEYNNNTLIYETKDGDNEKIKISQTASYILNGSNENYSNTIFNFDLGHITLISSNNSSLYDIVIINKADVLKVGTIDLRNNKVYDKYTSSDFVDFSDYDLKYEIENAEGEKIGFTDIKENDVLTVYKGKNKVRVIVTDNTDSGTVESTDSEGFMLNDKEYKYNFYGLNRNSAVLPGNSVTIYLDAYGNVTDAEKILTAEKTFAYLTKLKPVTSGIEENIIAKLYTPEGKFVEFSLSEKITINGNYYKNKTYNEILGLISVENSYNGVVNYNVTDGKITSLETAKAYSEFSDSENGMCLRYETREREYFKASKSFEYGVYYSNDTVFFKVPSDPVNANEEDFEIVTSAYFSDGALYSLCGYTDNKDDVESTAIVVTGNVYPDEFEGHDVLAAVSKVTTALNENGEQVRKISVVKGIYGDSQKKKDLYINIYENVKDEDNNYTFNDITEGDIVKFMYDKDGRIRKFKLFYKYSNGNLIDKTTDSDTNSNDLDNINRVVNTTITSVNRGYVECGNGELYKISDLTVIVLETRPGYAKVSEGEISDLIVNEQCIIQMISKRPYTIFVFK